MRRNLLEDSASWESRIHAEKSSPLRSGSDSKRASGGKGASPEFRRFPEHHRLIGPTPASPPIPEFGPEAHGQSARHELPAPKPAGPHASPTTADPAMTEVFSERGYHVADGCRFELSVRIAS